MNPRLAALFVCLFLPIATCLAAPEEPENRTLRHDNLDRTYFRFDPRSGVAPETNEPRISRAKRPLILVLHGGGGKANKFDITTGAEHSFNALAKREDILVVYPQGTGKQWNDGREAKAIPAQRLNVDDVGFLSSIIDREIESGEVDPKRVFVTGCSNGGFMTNRVACELSNKVAGVAIVIAGMPTALEPRCRPNAQVSVLIMNGTADPLVPYVGGEVKILGTSRGVTTSSDQTFQFWLERAGYHGQTSAIRENKLPDIHTTDNSWIGVRSFESSSGVGVSLYTVHGGGHTWPGGRQYLFRSLVGEVNQDIDATQVIWDFFRTHARR